MVAKKASATVLDNCSYPDAASSREEPCDPRNTNIICCSDAFSMGAGGSLLRWQFRVPPSCHRNPPIIAKGTKKNRPNGLLYQYSRDHTHVVKSDQVCTIVAPNHGLVVIPGTFLFKGCVQRHLPPFSETGRTRSVRVQRKRPSKLGSDKSVSYQ